MSVTLYGGYVVNEYGNKIMHYTDDKDALPPDLVGYEEQTLEDFSITTFLREAFKGEQRGFRYVIQIKDLYYETPEE